MSEKSIPRRRFSRYASVLFTGAFLCVAHSADAVQFQALQTLQGGIGFTTVLTMGPEDPNPATTGDGCIYAVNGSQGAVHRICFDNNKSVSSDAIVIDLNGAGGTNNTLGIAIDPDSDPAGEIHLYLGYADNNGAPFNGKIARAVSTDGGVTYATDEDFITGLGRSSFDHQTNGLDFGPDGCLYVAQGNNSNAGYDSQFAENRFSSAMLRACFKNAGGGVDPAFDRNCGDGDAQQACDVEVYASGLRNPYDLVWHSNGRLYNTDNDANVGFRDNCGSNANTFDCPCQQPSVNPIGDELNLIEQDKYYGSPNPYMANPNGLQLDGSPDGGDSCSPEGGNCKNLASLCANPVLCDEDVQCLYFGGGQPGPTPAQDPKDLYRAPINQAVGSTLDGMTEYEPRFANAALGDFCSDWDGDLLVTAGPGTVRRYSLSPDGLIATHAGTGNLNGASGLDVVVGPDGTIYIADLNAGAVDYLEPITQPSSGSPDFFLPCAPGQACVGGTTCLTIAGCTIDADCDDGNECTIDACNAGTCEFTDEPDGTACDDGDPGTINDQCTSGFCIGQTSDPDNDGLSAAADPCPGDPLNACFGPVAVDGTTGNAIRLDAGPSCSGPFTDCRGATWLADFGYNQSASSSTCNLGGGCPVDASDVFGCTDAATEALFKCEHWDAAGGAELQYSFDVPNGDYVVNLLFMNSYTGTASAGSRVFDLVVEGATVYPNFDQVVAAGGSGIPVVRAAAVTVSDGNGLQIEFVHLVENPAVKGIEVLAQGGPPPDCTLDAECDDNVECTLDSCVAGVCINDAAAADGNFCNDGIFCTFGDQCSGGICQPGIPDSQQCDDGVACTEDVCDVFDDCVSTPNDGNCDDLNACTDDSCDAVLGCQASPNTDPCNDGLACTASDVCGGGVCSGSDTCPAGQSCQPSGTCDASGTDADNDGFSPPADCNDNDADVYPGAPEICDGADNDCGGQIDEGNPGGGVSCGTGQPGVCAAGTTQCSGGAVVCVPNTSPSAETCNGLDDDCDGGTDEDTGGGSCATGQPGVCAAGTEQCQSGSLVCVQDNSPSAETCNGLDDDCDGSVDEGNPGGGATCSTGQPGACSTGTEQCVSGAITCVADTATTEVCNGVDDDCDGTTDEDTGGGVCGTGQPGVCAAGTEQCQSGSLVCVQDNTPSAEACNGLDDDCDGSTDEDTGGATCSTGQAGICAAGTEQCQSGSLVCVQDEFPAVEACNGLDDDCNGAVDDGNPGGGATCSTGQPGACASGVEQCVSGAIICVADAGSPETCNGIDDDCDGTVDEGNPDGGAVCSTGQPGACDAGTEQCQGGSLVCVADSSAGQEICNGLDDDCDGSIDEGNPDGGAACSTGVPGVCDVGTEICLSGAITCVADNPSSAETCNGLDDDCNGSVDDGNPGGGGACTTGLPGVCSTGVFECTGGLLQCAADAGSPETCNGIDDDCDGVIDDGNPDGGAACSSGQPGICDAGSEQCSGGTLVCVADLLPDDEICSTGVDEDCDGSVDETDDCLLCLSGDTVSFLRMTRRNVVKLNVNPNRDAVIAGGTFVQPSPSFSQPDEQEVTVRLTDDAGAYYEATLPIGSMAEAANGRRFDFKDRTAPYENAGLKLVRVKLKSDLLTTKYKVRTKELELPDFVGLNSMFTFKIGNTCYVDTVDMCEASANGRKVKCR